MRVLLSILALIRHATRPIGRVHLLSPGITLVCLGATPLLAAVPSYVVTTATDDATSSSGNCTNQNAPGAIADSSCGLRDALAASSASGGAITFSPAVFAATKPAEARMISLGSAGALSVPSNTTITGLTTGSGWTLQNLVTITVSEPYHFGAFTVASGVTSAAIAAITIAGNQNGSGSGIVNHGALSVATTTIANNNSGLDSGGGIYNDGTLTITDSTVSGNQAYYYGGGIYNHGTMTVTNTTISNNLTEGGGGGIYNDATLNLVNNTIAWNKAGDGGGLYNTGSQVITSTLLTNNATGEVSGDCGGLQCPVSGSNGNLSGSSAVTELGNYGGPTQTIPPIPGSQAICAGQASAPTTDQRGLPRSTVYAGVTCFDTGAVQTHYSLGFAPAPPQNIGVNLYFPVGAQLLDGGNATPVAGVGILFTLHGAGILGFYVAGTDANGFALIQNENIDTVASGDTITVSVPLTTSPPPAPLSSPITLSATSSPFNVITTNEVENTITSFPSGLTIVADGVSYTTPVSLAWVVGSQHTLGAPSPQSPDGSNQIFQRWSDDGASYHTITVPTPLYVNNTFYTATFGPADCVLTTAVSPAGAGTVSPASGSYYICSTNSNVNLVATARPGYYFTGWTGGGITNPSNPDTVLNAQVSETVTAHFAAASVTAKTFVIGTNLDNSAGIPAHCTSQNNSACTLRDALAAAGAAGGGTITFDPVVFASSQPAAARNITLTKGTLSLPASTSVHGPTVIVDSTITSLVTVTGDRQNATMAVAPGVANVTLANLTITAGGAYILDGGNVRNDGTLAMVGCTVTAGVGYLDGAGILNNGDGTLTILNSNIEENGDATSYGDGPGILNRGSLKVINSTVLSNVGFRGAGIFNAGGSLVVADSEISGNSDTLYPYFDDGGPGAGILNTGPPISVFNSIVANNTDTDTDENGYTTTVEDDCQGAGCPVSGTQGNLGGASSPSALRSSKASTPKASLTDAIIPMQLPGSPVLCAGIVADIPSGLTTDIRGVPRTTAYGSTTCVDSGPYQQHYALDFSTQPPASLTVGATFAAALTLTESGNPVGVSLPISLALGTGDQGSLSGNTAGTYANGVTTFSQLAVSSAGSDDSLVAGLEITSTPPPSTVTGPIYANAVSHAFNVTSPESISLGALPTSITLREGQTGYVTVSVTPAGGFAGTVTFACTPRPALVSCSFSPKYVTVSNAHTATTTLIVQATSSIGSGSSLPAAKSTIKRPPLGLGTINVTASGSGVSQSYIEGVVITQ